MQDIYRQYNDLKSESAEAEERVYANVRTLQNDLDRAVAERDARVNVAERDLRNVETMLAKANEQVRTLTENNIQLQKQLLLRVLSQLTYI